MSRTNNRAEILRVALELFTAQGYDATGVQEIVEAAGVAKPTLYHYFGSKRGLLEALLDEGSAAFLGELEQAAAYNRNLPVTLQKVVAAYLGFVAAQPTFYRFLLSLLFVPVENEAHGPAERVIGSQQRILENLFEASARDHGNMRGRQQRYARSLLGVLASYGLLIVNGQLKLDAQLTRDIVQQFSHGIYS